MRQIEERVFAAGMPVAALMEKVAGRITNWIQTHYPQPLRVGVLVGPGHNGGDALVVARELHFRGYEVLVYAPFERLKDLTADHARYIASLGIPWFPEIEFLQHCDLFVDGLFGFGLERPITDPVAQAIARLNTWPQPIISIDLPSGLHTDTGEVLGVAVQATHTLCLGLWKLGLLQDKALAYVGQASLLDFDLPLADIHAVLGDEPTLTRISAASAIAALPLHRPTDTHKYQQGHVLVIAGSRRYGGAAILAGLGAKASGAGMVSLAVPESLQAAVLAQLPDALVISCDETSTGAIAAERLAELANRPYDAIACGPGLTPEAVGVVQWAILQPCPLILDADGLNILASLGIMDTLAPRTASTILTPHTGEFKRLFPDFDWGDRYTAATTAAEQSGAIVVLKGARTVIAQPHGPVAINPDSTPALARGGSGDVLTGLMGGLVAQAIAADQGDTVGDRVAAAVWWHAQAGILAAQERTVLGVDAISLSQYLLPALHQHAVGIAVHR